MTVNEAMKRALTCLNAMPRTDIPQLGEGVDSYRVASELEKVLLQLMCDHEPWDEERAVCPKCGKVHEEPVVVLRNIMPYQHEVSYLTGEGRQG